MNKQSVDNHVNGEAGGNDRNRGCQIMRFLFTGSFGPCLPPPDPAWLR